MTRETPNNKSRGNRLGMVGTAGLLSLGATGASVLLGSWNFTIGVAVGGGLMTGDIYLLEKVVKGFLSEEPKDEAEAKRKRRRLLFQYLLKVIGLLVVLGVVIWKSSINPAGLVTGVTAAILGPLYVGLRDANVES